MDSALKQNAVVAEATVGTTPTAPAFKILRDITVTGEPQRNSMRSPERVANRQANSMVTGLNSYPKAIQMPWVRDAGLDVIWESLFGAAFSGSNILLIGSTQKTFTLEEKFGGTSIYRRTAGVEADTCRMSWQIGQPGALSFGLKGLQETTASAALGTETYAAASPGYDPVSPVNITVNSLFGLGTSVKVQAIDLTITNNLFEQWKFGSADPFAVGMGLFDVSGTVSIYMGTLTDYSTFASRVTGQTFDITIGSVSSNTDRLVLGAVDVWNPVISDPGASGVHLVTLSMMGKYFGSDTSTMKLTRNV